jgi:hypothetical protein
MNTKHKHLTRLVKRLVAVRDARAEAYNSTADRPRLQSVDDDLWQRWNKANNRCDVAFKKLWTCIDENDAKEKGQRTTGVVSKQERKDDAALRCVCGFIGEPDSRYVQTCQDIWPELFCPKCGKIVEESGAASEIKPTQNTPLVPEWISIEVKATFEAMLRAGNIGSYRIMERMVRRIGYGDLRDPSLALDVPIHSKECAREKGEVQPLVVCSGVGSDCPSFCEHRTPHAACKIQDKPDAPVCTEKTGCGRMRKSVQCLSLNATDNVWRIVKGKVQP